MAHVVYVDRMGLKTALARVREGQRVCVNGRWHTVRSIGVGIPPFEPSRHFGFEDGGGAEASRVDAVYADGVITTACTTGALPPGWCG